MTHTSPTCDALGRWGAQLGLAAAIGAWPAIAAAQEDYAPPQPLKPVSRATLDIEPRELVLKGDELLVIGSAEDGTDRLVALDARSLEVLQSRALSFHVESMHVSADGRHVFVGDDGGEGVIEVLDKDFSGLGRLALPRSLEDTASFLSSQGTLLILAGSRSEISGYTVNVADLLSGGAGEGRPLRLATTGALDVWSSDLQQMTFVNGAAGPKLMAIDFGSGLPIDGLISRYTKGEPTPFSVFGLMDDLRCRGDSGTSFLVADNDNDTLSLIDYDETFRTLDVQARTRAAPRLAPGTFAATYEGSDRLRPAALLASSCDQTVIWLGSIYSDQILQFARNPTLGVLETVAEVDLDFQPSALILGVDGSFGFAAAAEDRMLVRFGLAAAEPTGDESVRILQRLLTYQGFEIGPIDGILGSETMQAVNALETELGVELDVEDDLVGSVNALREALAN